MQLEVLKELCWQPHCWYIQMFSGWLAKHVWHTIWKYYWFTCRTCTRTLEQWQPTWKLL